MSLRNDIDMVKEELNSEEKFFEKAVMTEKFVKKYKKLMIGSVVAVVVFVSANIIYDITKQNKIEKANELLSALNKDATNTTLMAELKSTSPNLYDVWMLSQAVADANIEALKDLQHSKAIVVGDIATYELAQDTNDAQSLSTYASKQDAIYRDLAQVQSAVIFMKDGKIDEAHQKLALISQESPMIKIAQALRHYGVK